MTNDDDLRARLARLDPVRPGLEESPTAHEIRERIVQTIDDTTTPTPLAPRRRSRVPLLAGAAAAAVASVAVGAAVLGGGSAPAPAPRTPTTLTLNAPGGGVSMGSCVPFSADLLRDMPVAFGGTVAATSAGSVALDVDRWYKGGSADRVTIATPDGTTSVALDGVEFTQGGRYLVTATDGTVNTCGFSGPATAELEKAFAEAFPSA